MSTPNPPYPTAPPLDSTPPFSFPPFLLQRPTPTKEGKGASGHVQCLWMIVPPHKVTQLTALPASWKREDRIQRGLKADFGSIFLLLLPSFGKAAFMMLRHSVRTFWARPSLGLLFSDCSASCRAR
jgi:hypothetical protein